MGLQTKPASYVLITTAMNKERYCTYCTVLVQDTQIFQATRAAAAKLER